MNAVKLQSENAFSAGADLWLIENSSQGHWWQELDLRSHFLLTRSASHSTLTPESGLVDILAETGLKHADIKFNSDYLLIGASDHFNCRWILLWNPSPTISVDHILSIGFKLQAQSLRFYGSHDLAREISTRPTASSLTISYIENP